MIASGELTAFMNDMKKRETERVRWDYYLSRVFNKSYADWLDEIDGGAQGRGPCMAQPSMTQEQIIEQTLRIAAISRGEV